jgi:hypothetical protein
MAAAAALIAIPIAAPAEEDAWQPGKFMTQAIGKIMASARNVTQKTQFGLDDGSSCFMGALLKVGKQAESTIPLKGGFEYAFVGGGDDDAVDLDLYLVDPEGKIIARDVDDDPTPVVVFKAPADGQYRILLKLAESRAMSSFCGYATMRSGGFDVPPQNLTTCAARLMKLCEIIANKTGGAAFHDDEGEWALVGSILAQGQTLTQNGIELPEGKHAFAATGDTQAEDLDLIVLGKDGKQQAVDTDDDANPVVLFEKPGNVALKLSAAKSKGPTLAMAAVLKTK